MKLSFKNRMILLLLIGFIFIGFGISNMVFKFNIDQKIMNYGETGLFIFAAIIYFSGHKKDKNESDSKEDKNI